MRKFSHAPLAPTLRLSLDNCPTHTGIEFLFLVSRPSEVFQSPECPAQFAHSKPWWGQRACHSPVSWRLAFAHHWYALQQLSFVLLWTYRVSSSSSAALWRTSEKNWKKKRVLDVEARPGSSRDCIRYRKVRFAEFMSSTSSRKKNKIFSLFHVFLLWFYLYIYYTELIRADTCRPIAPRGFSIGPPGFSIGLTPISERCDWSAQTHWSGGAHVCSRHEA